MNARAQYNRSNNRAYAKSICGFAVYSGGMMLIATAFVAMGYFVSERRYTTWPWYGAIGLWVTTAGGIALMGWNIRPRVAWRL